MSADKELYHLVRKYKYFYKKLEDLKEFNEKYHDVDLSKDINVISYKLNRIQMRMFKEILNALDVHPVSAEIETALTGHRRYDCIWKLYSNKNHIRELIEKSTDLFSVECSFNHW